MALIGNRSVLHKSPGRFLAGTVASGDRSNFSKHGMVRSSRLTYGKLAALPNGYGGMGWMMPVTAGAISSTNAAVASFSGTASGALGFPIEGTADFSIVTNTPTGQLISSGTGTASMTFTFANALLTASLNALGSTSFTLATNAPLLGAEASAVGATSFAITGTLTPYAIGSMSGSTVDTSTIVNANIVSVNGYSVTGNGQTGTEWGPV